jgi:hypothetical protein
MGRLKSQDGPPPLARKPRKPQAEGGDEGFLGFLAYLPTRIEKNVGIEHVGDEALRQAVNDGEGDGSGVVTVASQSEEDGCWPHSRALTTVEIHTFLDRMLAMAEKGLTVQDAEQLAERLLWRDRDGDDRRICLECCQLQGRVRRHCGQKILQGQLSAETVQMLQRCEKFIASDRTRTA